MKKLALFILSTAFFLSAQAQSFLNVGNTLQRRIIGTDTTFRFNMGSPGFMYFPTTWWVQQNFAPIGTSGVTSFNGRTGAITPLVGDYSSFYPLLNGTGATGSWNINAATVTNGVYTSGSYSNPSWITDLAWSKITGAPSSFPTPNAVTFNNGGAGAASGTTFDGSAATTISYNTIGAQPLLGYTPEDVANKTATQSSSTTTYPNWLGVTNYVSTIGGNYVTKVGAEVTDSLVINTYTAPTVTATFLGNSITNGSGSTPISSPYTNGYAQQLTRALNVTLNNLSVDGATIDLALTTLWASIPSYNAVTHPYIYVMWGANEYGTQMPIADYMAKYNAQLDSLNSIKGYPFANIRVIQMPYICGNDFAIPPAQYAAVDSAAAVDKGATLILTFWGMASTGGMNYLDDCLHPNNSGHTWIAQKVLTTLSVAPLTNVLTINGMASLSPNANGVFGQNNLITKRVADENYVPFNTQRFIINNENLYTPQAADIYTNGFTRFDGQTTLNGQTTVGGEFIAQNTAYFQKGLLADVSLGGTVPLLATNGSPSNNNAHLRTYNSNNDGADFAYYTTKGYGIQGYNHISTTYKDLLLNPQGANVLVGSENALAVASKLQVTGSINITGDFLQNGVVPTWNQNTTGKSGGWTTPRTFWGQTGVDGTGDVSGAMSDITSISMSGTLTSTVGNNSNLFLSNTATTGFVLGTIANSGGNMRIGVNGASAGLGTGTTAYSAVIGNAIGNGVDIIAGGASGYYMSPAGAHDFKSGAATFGGAFTITPFSTAGIVTNNSSGVLSTSTALPSGTTATTQSAGDNSTKVATTAYVDGAVATTFVSGTYTPTISNTTNVASSTANANTIYTKVGSMVRVDGSVLITPTANTTATDFEITLPIASDFTTSEQAKGVVIGGPANQVSFYNGFGVATNSTSDRVVISFVSNNTTSNLINFSFTYQVL